MPLPDFFVIGAPKAGTTALHVALARHPQLFMSRVKEPKHFLTDGPPPTGGGPGDAKTFREYVWRRGDYERLFDAAPAGTLRGESTPFYLHDHAAQQRIVEAVPEARMIALLRDPVDRAHSNWTHLWSAGLEPEGDFLRACDLEEPPGGARLGAVLALPGARPLRRAAAAAVRGGAARAGAAAALPGPARGAGRRPSTRSSTSSASRPVR